MTARDGNALFQTANWYRKVRGPRYGQLYRHIATAIATGDLPAEGQLRPERDLVDIAEVSRVPVRQAVKRLVDDGMLQRRHGAGTYVRHPQTKLEQGLATLLSFTEYMRQRGKTSSSLFLKRGLFSPTPDELVALGLSMSDQVARVERVRSAGGVAVAVEWSSLPQDILPVPDQVEASRTMCSASAEQPRFGQCSGSRR